MNLGRLLPKHPAKNYGKSWFDDWRLTTVPHRIVWSLDKTDWSVEIDGARFVHGEPHASDMFLHVLHATDADAVEMAKVELVESTDTVGAKIATPDGESTLTFATAGPVSGHIRIVRGGRTFDADLADDVADNYDAWRDDPRYVRWMTDPYLKAAMTPAP